MTSTEQLAAPGATHPGTGEGSLVVSIGSGRPFSFSQQEVSAIAGDMSVNDGLPRLFENRGLWQAARLLRDTNSTFEVSEEKRAPDGAEGGDFLPGSTNFNEVRQRVEEGCLAINAHRRHIGGAAA